MTKGRVLEEVVDRMNKLYYYQNKALVQRIPTPTKHLEPLGAGKFVATYDKKSTVDFIGVVYQGEDKPGIHIAFDTKVTSKKGIPKANLERHQMIFLRDVNKMGGIGFLLINIEMLDEFIVLVITDDVVQRYHTKGKGFSLNYLHQTGIKITQPDIGPDYLSVINSIILHR